MSTYLYLAQDQATNSILLYRMKGGTDQYYSRLTLNDGDTKTFPVNWFTGNSIPNTIVTKLDGKLPTLATATTESGHPDKQIKQSELNELAQSNQISLPLLKAVLAVESQGKGFLSNGKPKILFEAQWFGHYTNDQYTNSHPTISCKTWAEARQHYEGGINEWKRFAAAAALNPTAAMLSASFGLGQIMGFNFKACGYSTVNAFVEDAHKSEKVQLQQMLNFIKSKGLMDELIRHDWEGFAFGYNGEGYKVNKYHIKLRDAYQQFAGELTDPTVSESAKLLHTVPFWKQTDNSRQPHSTCNISTHAMWVKNLKPDAINSDEEYLAKFFGAGYKDPTDHNAHTEFLRNHYKIESVWVTTATPDDLMKELQNNSVPIGILHRGTDNWPSPYESHITLARGRSADGSIWWLNDPYGSINNNYNGPPEQGKCVAVTHKRLLARWYSPPSSTTGGYMRKFIRFL